MDKVNKEVYTELVCRKCEIPSSRWEGWLEELKIDLNELDWLDCLPRIASYTMSTKLRPLGYRFNIRDVLINTKLIHIHMGKSTLCYLCNKEMETITDLYWECMHTKRL